MSDQTFDDAVALAMHANFEMVRGNSEPIKRLYSHRDDVTVLGGFGGFERGWNEVEPRLNWAASQFADGHYEQQEVSKLIGADLALIVTIERYRVRIADAKKETKLELRVTQAFRREEDGWKLVHRHADPLVNKQSPT
jgi:ketosteroid isomerase-like protein